MRSNTEKKADNGYGYYNCEDGHIVARFWLHSTTCDENVEQSKAIIGDQHSTCVVDKGIGASILYDCSNSQRATVSWSLLLFVAIAFAIVYGEEYN